jgi:hypothetical protein
MTAGAAYGFSGISKEDALYINEAVSQLDQQHDFQQELLDQLERQLPEAVQATPEQANVQVVVQLVQIDFVQRSGDNILLSAQGSMFLGWNVSETAQTSRRFEFSVGTEEKDIDAWLADDGRQLGAGIRECIAELANTISTKLLQIQSAPESLETNR